MADAKEKRTPVTIRLSPSEKAELQNLAVGMGISDYVRRCVFGRNARPRKPRGHAVVKDRQALAQALGLLGKSEMSDAMKRLAYEAECGSLLLDEQTEREIKLACSQIAFIRIKLIEALGLKDNVAA